MTNRERYIACATGKHIDRTPFPVFRFGPWFETILAWRAQGIEHPESAWAEGFGFEPGVINTAGGVNLLFCPGFETKVLERRGNVVIMQEAGRIVERVEGKDGLPKIIKPAVTCMEDWETI